MKYLAKLVNRSVAGTDLSCDIVMMIGKAIAQDLFELKDISRPKVLVGMDTRISSPIFKAALSAGLCSIGVDVIQLGVLPTSAVAYLVKLNESDLGIKITASHNPAGHNGIKIFYKDGFVSLNTFEVSIENYIFNTSEKKRTPSIRFFYPKLPVQKKCCQKMVKY